MRAAADGSGAVGTAPVPVSAVALLPAFPLADDFFFDFPSDFPLGVATELDGLTRGDAFGSVCSADEGVADAVVVVVVVVVAVVSVAAVVVVVVVVVVAVVAVVSVKRRSLALALSASVNPSG